MKTGRSRSKEGVPEAQPLAQAPAAEAAPAPAAAEPGAAPAPSAARGPRGNLVLWGFVAVVGVIACIVLFTLLRGCGGAKEWVPVSRATGDWTAGVVVYGPQVSLQPAFEADCRSQGRPVQAGTCVQKDTGTYDDRQVQTFEEYAYNTYFEETWSQVYQAQGTEFVTTSLGGGDRWEGNLHSTWVEKLKQDTCQQTNYTVWVDNAQDRTQQDEVYLFDCEVWNDTTVTERVYDQAPWCQCEVTALAVVSQNTSGGKGSEVAWPQANVPAGGRADESFTGRVTFTGGDYTLTTTTTDPEQYRDWLISPYYLGIRGGRAVEVSKSPPE
jgi:hypothetical protein